MNFEQFNELFCDVKESDLPGEESQFAMVPSIRPNLSWEDIRKLKPTLASVLLLIYPNENNESNFVLIQRKEYKGTHSAQISLPGGKLEKNETLQAAALRETFEEVGVFSDAINVTLQLTDVWVAPSKFLVTPFLGIAEKKPIFIKDTYEVDEIIEVKLSDFIKDNCLGTEIVNSSYVKNLKVPSFRLNDKIVWGATAMILNEFRDLVLNKVSIKKQ